MTDEQAQPESNTAGRFCHPTQEPLLKHMLDLEQFVSADQLGVDELRGRLEAMRSDIREHFRSEEQSDGALDAVTRSEPRFAHAAQHLIDKHRNLEQGLDTLLDVAATAESIEDALRRKVCSWIARARKHEADEDTLLLEAINQELGTAD